MREAWDWIDNTPLEVVDAGDVLVFRNHLRLRARGSGVEFDSHVGFVFWIERGLIVRERDFSDWDEALRVAGVSTPTADARRSSQVTPGTTPLAGSQLPKSSITELNIAGHPPVNPPGV
jgi:hypothetical protein